VAANRGALVAELEVLGLGAARLAAAVLLVLDRTELASRRRRRQDVDRAKLGPMAEDFLPHEPPPPPPAAKRSGKRVFATWVILILMFVVIYAMFDRSPQHGARAATDASAAGYSGFWLWVTGVAGMATTTAAFLWLWGGAHRYQARQRDALAALGRRDYARAATLFDAVARSYPAHPSHRSGARYHQGYALLRSGDTEAAVGALLAADRTPELALSGFRQFAAIELARAFAVGGDTDKARRWVDSARSRGGGLNDSSRGEAQLALVEGLVRCRQGRLQEALAHYAASWQQLETHVSVDHMREAWLLRAFAIAATSGPRDAGALDPWLRMLWGTPPGTFDWLTGRWPELATFMMTHGLVAQPTRNAVVAGA